MASVRQKPQAKHKEVVIQGEKVLLRPITLDDVTERYVAWMKARAETNG